MTISLPNNRKEGARLLYMMELASCSCPQSGCFTIIDSGQEHDFFAVDVRRHHQKGRKLNGY